MTAVATSDAPATVVLLGDLDVVAGLEELAQAVVAQGARADIVPGLSVDALRLATIRHPGPAVFVVCSPPDSTTVRELKAAFDRFAARAHHWVVVPYQVSAPGAVLPTLRRHLVGHLDRGSSPDATPEADALGSHQEPTGVPVQLASGITSTPPLRPQPKPESRVAAGLLLVVVATVATLGAVALFRRSPPPRIAPAPTRSVVDVPPQTCDGSGCPIPVIPDSTR